MESKTIEVVFAITMFVILIILGILYGFGKPDIGLDYENGGHGNGGMGGIYGVIGLVFVVLIILLIFAGGMK